MPRARRSTPERAAGSYWLGAVFVGSSEFAELQAALDSSQMTLQWQYPLRLGQIGAGQAAALNDALGNAVTNGGLLTRSVRVITSVSVSCGLTGALLQFIAAQARIGTLLALLEVSLVILGAVVLLLGCRLLAERRAAEFALMRARGAGRGQLATLALRAGLIAVLPAAVAGALAAVLLTPGGSEPAAAWLGALTALAALAGVPVVAVRQARDARRRGRPRPAAAGRRPGRPAVQGQAAGRSTRCWCWPRPADWPCCGRKARRGPAAPTGSPAPPRCWSRSRSRCWWCACTRLRSAGWCG